MIDQSEARYAICWFSIALFALPNGKTPNIIIDTTGRPLIVGPTTSAANTWNTWNTWKSNSDAKGPSRVKE